MKASLATPLLILIILLLESCDPAKLLVIKADNKNKTSVTVYTIKKIMPFSNQEDDSRLIIRVPFKDTTIRRFYYGIGNWSNEAISKLATIIDSIIIIKNTDKMVLVEKSDIQAYLKQRRSGYAGSVLTIEAP